MTAALAAARRLLERFALLALGLYHLPLFLNNYPSLGGGGFNSTGLAPRWGHVFTGPGLWVATHVLGVKGATAAATQGDNGDVGEEFGRLLLSVVIAAVGAIAWTLADRRRPRAPWVGEATRTLLRYAIALGIASYGIAKILPMQFPPLAPLALEQRVGDLAPMSLLWMFMEYSRPYALFGGVMELAAAVLLCFRRTATLGALVTLAVMTNVALLNYAYGVPVKLYSTMIVVSAAVLAAYDARRLLAVFVRNTPAPADTSRPLLHDRIPPAARWTIKIALVASVVVSSVVAMRSAIGERPALSPLDGGWTVTSLTRNGAPAASSDRVFRWKSLIIQGGRVVIRLEDDGVLSCASQAASPSRVLTLRCSNGRTGALAWTRADDTLQLRGAFDDGEMSIAARRRDYLLLRSPFRLISDR